MLTKLIFFILQLKTYVQNITSRICEKICSIESVYSLRDNKISSIYLRYLFILILSYFKCIMLRTVYSICLDLFDINTEYIQVIKKVRGVEHYIIYDVSLETNSISKMIENVNKYSKIKTNDVNLASSYIVRECSLVHNNNKICLKKIFTKYSTDKNMKISIRNILLFNKIDYDNNDIIIITIIKDGKKVHINYSVSDILYLSVYDIYQT